MAKRITVRRLVPVDKPYKAPLSAQRMGQGEIIGDGTKMLVTMQVDAQEWLDFQAKNPDGPDFPDFPSAGPVNAV